MSRLLIPLRRWSVAACLSLVLTGAQGAPAFAPDDDEDDLPLVAFPRQPVYVVNEELFKRMVFGNESAVTARTRLESVLSLKIADITRRCGLSEVQKEKLELAGQCDLKRMFDKIEDRKVLLNRQVEQDEYAKLMQEFLPLRFKLSSDLFGDGSFFAKALKGMLDEGQVARYGGTERDLKRQRYLARIAQAVVSLDSSMALSAEQRRRLTNLLAEETRPPKVFSSYDTFVVLYQMARLPEARLKPIFDDQQWLSLSRRLEQAKTMEQVLKNGGYLPEGAATDPAATPKAPFEIELRPARRRQ